MISMPQKLLPTSMRDRYNYRTLQELRAPLFAIAGLSEALASHLDEREEAETARLIARSSEQLIRRLDLMLASAPQEATYRKDLEQSLGRTHQAE